VQLADAGLDLEHRGLVGVPRDTGRRLGLPNGIDTGRVADQALPLIANPGGTRPGFTVRQREDQVAKVLAARAQRGLGRIGWQAADEQQLTRYARRHRRLLVARPVPEHSVPVLGNLFKTGERGRLKTPPSVGLRPTDARAGL
jgi:hypothetical protein